MSHQSAALVVDSVTGVEVELPVAGPGARAYAFTIDWHIRAVLAFTWYVIGMMIYNQGLGYFGLPTEADGRWMGFVAGPAVAIYFLYHPFLEIGMHGRTPGKRMAGVRLVTRHGGTPTFGAYLLRNVFRVVDNFPMFYGLGLLMTMITRNHVRLGDLAAGTLLIYDRRDASLLEHVQNHSLDATTAEVINELLRRWDTLDEEARRKLAAQIFREPLAQGDVALRAQLERIARGAQS